MKKFIFSLFLLLLLPLTLTSCSKEEDTDIVSTFYAGYDFARAVAKDDMTASMLLSPGEEVHSYSPSISDIKRCKNSKVFIYVGGESDEEFVEDSILPELSKDTKVISMMDVLFENDGDIYKEEDPITSLEDDEYDEHIWTSPKNVKIIINYIKNVLKEIDEENSDNYINNANEYIASLNIIDTQIRNIVDNSTNKFIVVADRFPLLYFVKEYNLEYIAAFKGCEEVTDAAPTKIKAIVDKVIEKDINYIFVIEKSNKETANIVKDELKSKNKDVEILTFYTMHNVSKRDYEDKKTYIDFMNHNIEALHLALN